MWPYPYQNEILQFFIAYRKNAFPSLVITVEPVRDTEVELGIELGVPFPRKSLYREPRRFIQQLKWSR